MINGLPLRVLHAENPGPFTLDGTRTYIVGERVVAIVDPGPEDPDHVRSIHLAVSEADQVTVVLTHRHPDHAAAAHLVAGPLGAPILGTGQLGENPLKDGATVQTDAGELVAVSTPGHCDAHLSLFWPGQRALFCGDLLLGEGSTTWVAGYPTCVADYLASLDRVAALDVATVFPTHGAPITEPDVVIDRFRAHRLERVEQVREAQLAHPDADLSQLVAVIYGSELPSGMQRAAEASVAALRDYLTQNL